MVFILILRINKDLIHHETSKLFNTIVRAGQPARYNPAMIVSNMTETHNLVFIDFISYI